GMTCASCVRRVERALSKVEGVETATVNFATETARIVGAPSVTVDALVAAVRKAGYEAAEHDTSEAQQATRDESASRTLRTLAWGAILATPTIILSMAGDIAGLYLFDDMQLHGWVILALATPIQVGLGWRFYKGSWGSL